MKKQYYSFNDLVKKYPECKYYIVYGERSNGKSYSGHSYGVKEFYDSNFENSYAYIRRWTDDVKTSNMEQVYKNLISNDKGENEISKITNGEYNYVVYKSRAFYLAYRNPDTFEIEKIVDHVMCYVFSLSESERIKSTGYPDVKFIMFDEFIAEGLPMVNEFTRFTSVLSTIIRNRDDVIIALFGNTINKYNIYFTEFGLFKAKNQKKNTTDIYEYTDEDGQILKIACEYADFPDKKVKKSNIYFAFNKEKNKMIRNGSWQISSYPHLTNYYTPADIKLMYFIKFDNELFQCEIIKVKDNKDTRIDNRTDSVYSNKNIVFTYIHRKTTDIKDMYDHIIFQQDYNPHNNIRRKINNPYDDIGKFIWNFFCTDSVMYQDNEVGNAIDSYLTWTRTQ